MTTIPTSPVVESVQDKTLVLNMGPQHPSTHGVLRLLLEIDGETVISLKPDIGYLHTGIEKTCEAKFYQQVVPLTDRIDYLCPLINNLAYVMEIVRGDNRDKSGINDDFLCVKGRYAFDFAQSSERLKHPLIRKDGKLTPATWEEAFELIGKRFVEVRDRDGGGAIGVIGSNRTTNEENYLLSKFARVVLKTNNIDHHRTADFPALAAALSGKPDITATMRVRW